MSDQDVVADKPAVSHSARFISVIVPVYNGAEDLERCLTAINRSDWPAFECIVVDDASTDPKITEIANHHGVRLVRMEHRCGPALARNVGVKEARGEIIFFTDADVLLHSDAISKAMRALESDSGVAAVFGSYDDNPDHESLISRYRNLYHHWNHQIANEEASTFWTGCGAIRKDVFMAMDGFSSGYKRPSIEDIELGYRLRAAGYRIRLLKTMLATHLKRWKIMDMVRTDIFRRGAPWVALLWQHRSAPADLNLNPRAKIATVSATLLSLSLLLAIPSGHSKAVIPTLAVLLAAVLCACLTEYSDEKKTARVWKSTLALLIGIFLPLLSLVWVQDAWALLPLMLIAVIAWAQKDFYLLLSERGGIGFAFAVLPLQVLFFVGCALSVPLGFIDFLRQRRTAQPSG